MKPKAKTEIRLPLQKKIAIVKKIVKPKREKRLPDIKIELDLYRTKEKAVQEPENQSLIILPMN